MSPFWYSFCQQLKHGGKNGNLFIVILLGFGVTLALSALIMEPVSRPYALTVVGGCALLWICGVVRRFLAQRRHTLHDQPLSEDELTKARTKLKLSRSRGE